MGRVLILVGTVLLGVGLLGVAPTHADDGARAQTGVDARARILAIEMNRGATADLLPFVQAGGATWTQAVRAAGRMGDTSSSLLRDLLTSMQDRPAAERVDARLVLWSAGLPWVGDASTDNPLRESWATAVRPYLAFDDEPHLVAAAAHALGWIAAPSAGADLLPLLHHQDTSVRAEALNALGRSGQEGHLERCLRFLGDADAGVRAAAQFAGWRLAGRRRAAARKSDPSASDVVLAHQALATLTHAEPEVRMGALRIAGLLLPKTPGADSQRMLAPAGLDTDPRVAQDYVWRILQSREGDWVERELIAMSLRVDPKVRGLAYDALGTRSSPETLKALQARAQHEDDERLLDQLAVVLVKRKDNRLLSRLVDEAASGDEATHAMRRAEAFIALESKRAAYAVREWLSLEHALAGAEHDVVWMSALDGLAERDDDDVRAWLLQLAASDSLRAKRPFVAAAAIDAVGRAKPKQAWEVLSKMATQLVNETPMPDVDSALMGALVATRPDTDEGRQALVQMLLLRVASAPSDFSRQTAIAHLAKLVPESADDDTPEPGNDWQGLPRPTQPLPGLTLSGSGAWLNEQEILQIADWIAARSVRCVFETTLGEIEVTLHPETAPVHSVNLVLASHAGLYNNTRWHRVVPNFVIQGGDPHGHGAGNGGWTVPDEITSWPYDRGALGMPKSTKDDGGCQIFIMHASYRPLDERYTNYATVVRGMPVVDRIRMGDQIVKSWIVTR